MNRLLNLIDPVAHSSRQIGDPPHQQCKWRSHSEIRPGQQSVRWSSSDVPIHWATGARIMALSEIQTAAV